ncbi:MAG: 50S ribosomal protein L25/general stress protein Ctc [Mariprofundaceae bacterium]|nr:50S ribosomal protein L25/general stress protein Ctc [Mariprofundaceae bacterium]
MADLIINADLRETTGKGDARRMRRAGLLPAIIYGAGKPDLAITLNANSIGKTLNDESFYTSMLEVNVAGKGKETVLLKDVQWDPIMDTAMHLDFMRVSSADSVTVEVPVVVVNYDRCPGDIAGGMLDLVRHVLEVTCRADSIPESVEIDCSNLDIGDNVHIKDITLPEGMEVLHDANFTILNVAAPKGHSEESDDDSEVSEEAES